MRLKSPIKQYDKHEETGTMTKSKPLENVKYERFCNAYVVSFNGRASALEAGYKRTSASEAAAKLLDMPEVQKRLQQLQVHFFKAKKLEREEVMRQLYYLCTRDVLDFCDKDTGYINIDDLRKLPKNLRASIDGVKVKQLYNKMGDVIGQEITITLSPKAKAIELAMKHFSLFAPDKLDVNMQGTLKVNWNEMFKSQRGETPEVEGLIEELPESRTQLIVRDAKGNVLAHAIPQ